jgi:predicted O-methyltransferase YrrM
MSQELWSAVDSYITDLFFERDPALEAALAASAAAGLPAINVSPTQGKLLHLLARMQNARRILELGTLGGYSTIWLARALPADGHLITLELEPKHGEVAQKNLTLAGVADRVTIRIGRALDSLQQLIAEAAGPFDLIFIDADKASYSDYLICSLKLARPGTLIIADNVVRKGAVADPASSDVHVQGIRRFNETLAKLSSVSTTVIQTVGSKGYDGMALILVTGELSRD